MNKKTTFERANIKSGSLADSINNLNSNKINQLHREFENSDTEVDSSHQNMNVQPKNKTYKSFKELTAMVCLQQAELNKEIKKDKKFKLKLLNDQGKNKTSKINIDKTKTKNIRNKDTYTVNFNKK